VTIREGDLFDGRFQIERLLGRGGMGEVWAARSMDEGRSVALKLLLEKSARKADLVARFEREARIAARVKSPFVCELYDSGRARTGELYLAFELLRGESMGERVRRDSDIPFSELTTIIDNVLEGTITAHAVGVVHRDLKPANIFLMDAGEPGPRAKILDFGISKILARSRSNDEKSLTTHDATLGSFAYMAPEQVRGAARADERADLYAIGAVVFRALAGRLPFEGTTAAMLVSQKLETEAPTLAEATGDQWPAGIERFLAKSLAKNRESRFGTAAEALYAWRALTKSHSRVLDAGRERVSSMTELSPEALEVESAPSITEVIPNEDMLHAMSDKARK
jgi:serine/threonine-protein kinase